MLKIYSTLFFCAAIFLSASPTHAQTTAAADSLKREILKLQLDLQHTQTNLGQYSKGFKRGILTSVIGYSIVIAGGVMLGTDNLNEWGQPLILAGGMVGVTGAVFLYNSHRYIERAAEPPPLPDK
ncbi:MAG: hypothetical protein ACLFUB_11470 [Cyclobacteriaceae bacterium]